MGERPRDTRVTFSSAQPAMYNQRPSFEISRPFGAVFSVPGTRRHPVSLWYSQTSPARVFVAAKPPSGRATTALNVWVESAGAQPTQVSDGGVAPASTSNTSIDSRVP